MKPAILALESGKVYRGQSFGFEGERAGEVVFNTSLTGYQEILTDPSYKGQIIVMTEPHIGNVGVNREDAESQNVFAEGLVVRESSAAFSCWRAQGSLQEYLTSRKIPAVSGIDTRALTRHLREAGAMRGILSSVDHDPSSLLQKIKNSPLMEGSDLVKGVSCPKIYPWDPNEKEWLAGENPQPPAPDVSRSYNVVVMDFGVKHNILRCLSSRGCRVNVVPAGTSARDILSLEPHGILLSNGPGDPAAVTYAVDTIRKLIRIPVESSLPSIPVFGICLGHQLLGLAFGGRTFKLKFGHRGSNHPVKDLTTGKIEITTQNHGFCVDVDSFPGHEAEMTHLNLNDHTMEGMRHKRLPVFSVQYHPESSAGPHDSRYLFDRFIGLMQAYKNRTAPETSAHA